MTFWSLGVLPLLNTGNWFDQRCPCIVFECSFLFWTIKCFLEPLPLTHALHNAYPTLIYVLACLSHVHMAICICLTWFGSLLVNLGGFEVQSKPATCMPPICLLRLTILSHCIINMFYTYLQFLQ